MLIEIYSHHLNFNIRFCESTTVVLQSCSSKVTISGVILHSALLYHRLRDSYDTIRRPESRQETKVSQLANPIDSTVLNVQTRTKRRFNFLLPCWYGILYTLLYCLLRDSPATIKVMQSRTPLCRQGNRWCLHRCFKIYLCL